MAYCFEIVMPLLLAATLAAAQKPTCPGMQRPGQTEATVWAEDVCPATPEANKSTDDFTSCCRVHAACYRTCGAPQRTCDRDLGVCLGRVCQDLALKRHREPCNARKKALKERLVNAGAHDAAQAKRCECLHANVIGYRFTAQATPIIQKLPLKFMTVEDKLAEFKENLIKEARFDGNEWRHLYDIYREHPALIPSEPTIGDFDGKTVEVDAAPPASPGGADL